jgi:hypothetical protein
MIAIAVDETSRTVFEVAGNLDDEVAEFIKLQDMQETYLDSIHTAFSSFPTCCS